MMNAYLGWLQKESIMAQQNVSLKKLSSFHIGGNARLVVMPATREELCLSAAYAVELGLRYVIIGNGTNVLFADEGFDGVIIHTSRLQEISVVGSTIFADCGVPLRRLSRAAQNASLSGFEFACGIPGNCGGGVFMNAGAFGHDLSEILDTCTYYDVLANRRVKIKASNLQFSYRHSEFMDHPHRIILGATFQLQPGDMTLISRDMASNSQARKERQPPGYNAGSIFKRPVEAPAGKLIDDCGLKGVRCGDAEISPIHAGFIVNLKNATARDVLELIAFIQAKVYETYQVQLEPEIRYIH